MLRRGLARTFLISRNHSPVISGTGGEGNPAFSLLFKTEVVSFYVLYLTGEFSFFLFFRIYISVTERRI